MKSATARHLLVETEELCNDGGDLGNFQEGQMVPEFDKVVFHEAINVVHGPVKTQFGFHLLETTSRND